MTLFNTGKIYPHSGEIIIKTLKEIFTEKSVEYPILALPKISTQRSVPGVSSPALELIIQPVNSISGPNNIFKTQSYNAFVFGKNEIEVEDLARITEAILSAIEGVNSIFSTNMTLGVTAFPVEQGFGCWMTFTANISGETFTL